MHRSVLPLIVISLAAACRPAPKAPAPAASAAVSADTWAIVDGRPIHRDAVEKAYRRMANPAETPSAQEALAAKLSLLNDLIVQDILLARARQLKIEVPVSEIDAAYADAKNNISDADFEQEL